MVAYLNSSVAVSSPSNVLETITPELAEQYIAKNTHNRSIREPDVLNLAYAIERNEWRITNQGIAFDRNGVLIDGQHRLRAIMLAGKPVQMFVTRGLAPDAAEAIDIGRKRTNADTLTLSGYSDAHMLAAAAVWLTRYEMGRMASGQVKLTPQQTKAILAAHPGLITTARMRPTPIRLLPKSLVLWLNYEFTRRDEEIGTAFIAGLCSGENIAAGDPVAAARKNLLRLLMDSGKRSDVYRAAIVIKAWNATVEGRPVQLLRWGAGEPFPEILSHRSA